MQDKLLTIQEVARTLGVSTKTLRRWDARGILVPQRTVGNQRRYTSGQVDSFRKPKYSAQTTSMGLSPLTKSELHMPVAFGLPSSLTKVESTLPKDHVQVSPFVAPATKVLRQDQKGSGRRISIGPLKLGAAFLAFVLLFSIAGSVVLTKYNLVGNATKEGKKLSSQFIKLLPDFSRISFSSRQNQLVTSIPVEKSSVLGESAVSPRIVFSVNVPSVFLSNFGRAYERVNWDEPLTPKHHQDQGKDPGMVYFKKYPDKEAERNF